MTCVLIMGHRKGLAKALSDMHIPFSLWSEKDKKKPPKLCDKLFVKPFPTSDGDTAKCLEEMSLAVKPTHVIAGTESAVYPAAIVRRYLGARAAPESILIRCTDKSQMKSYLSDYDIPMPHYIIARNAHSNKQIIEELGLPVVIKDSVSSGGRNIVYAHDENQLKDAMGPSRLYESYICGEEGSVESFIDNGEIRFTNITQYLKKTFINIAPAPFEKNEVQKILELNQKVIKALGINWGLTHLEFYRQPRGPIFGEIALRPAGGYIMDLMGLAYNFDPWKTFVNIELNQKQEYPSSALQFAAAIILHPGPMKVGKVNVPKLETFPTLKKTFIRKKIGDVISPRSSVRDEAGHLIFASKSIDDLNTDLMRMSEFQIFEM